MLGRDKDYIQSVKRRLTEFAEYCCYSCNPNDIIIYLAYVESDIRKKLLEKIIIDIRRLMSAVNPARLTPCTLLFNTKLAKLFNAASISLAVGCSGSAILAETTYSFFALCAKYALAAFAIGESVPWSFMTPKTLL